MKKKIILLLFLIVFTMATFPVKLIADDTNITSNEIPLERQLPRLVDEANLLTVEEVDRLTEKLDEISERQNLDVVIVTIDSL